MNIWKRYSMRVSKNWVKFNKMFTLSPCYGKGFESTRDLLFFFNVLGYLGTAWKESDAYPAITVLIMRVSSLTPSQRIEQAAELAEAQHRMGTEI